MLLRVLDLTFTDGWKAMFRFGLARLRSVEVRSFGPNGPGDERPGGVGTNVLGRVGPTPQCRVEWVLEQKMRGGS